MSDMPKSEERNLLITVALVSIIVFGFWTVLFYSIVLGLAMLYQKCKESKENKEFEKRAKEVQQAPKLLEVIKVEKEITKEAQRIPEDERLRDIAKRYDHQAHPHFGCFDPVRRPR